MKVALVHDWLTGMRGGEKIMEGLCELFPDATVYTLIYNPDRVSAIINRMPVKTSFLQRVPAIFKNYRYFLPFFPKAIGRFDLREYEMVISSSHCVAKGVKTSSSTCHICYCLTPMRYAWDFHGDYFGHWPPKIRKVINLILKKLRKWDLESSRQVDFFLAISQNIARKIKNIYGREVAGIIYPPVDTEFFSPPKKESSRDYFLIVSALVPYKKVDLAVESFNRSGLPLVIIGEGPERKRLGKLARPNVKFLGWQPKDSIREYYHNARALIFPGEEDFGIVPLEAQAMGCPVIAYGKGGVKETVLEEKTGIFFNRPQIESLTEAVKKFQNLTFDPAFLRAHALKFDRRVHLEKLRNFIFTRYQEFKGEKVA
ncbi:MAG: glycosyltransferase [Candidatus Ratteibacteria bacterium]|nr:glycosyltransferase [Candidatus Ratteibacteria bacterium]